MGGKLLPVAVLLLLNILTAAYAADQTVSVQGVLMGGVFYGPINFGKDPATDQLEESYYLQLPGPVEQQLDNAGRHDLVIKWRDRVSGCFVQLAAAGDAGAALKAKLGKKVKVKGVLFERYSPRHRTPLLLQVQQADTIDNYTWQ